MWEMVRTEFSSVCGLWNNPPCNKNKIYMISDHKETAVKQNDICTIKDDVAGTRG